MSANRRSAASSSTTTRRTPRRRARSACTASRIAAPPRQARGCATSAWRFDAAALTRHMARESAQEFEHWLAEGGLRNMPLSDLFNGLTQYLLQGGVPIAPASFRLLS